MNMYFVNIPKFIKHHIQDGQIAKSTGWLTIWEAWIQTLPGSYLVWHSALLGYGKDWFAQYEDNL